ncbi:YicS family protein [Escherichia coli]
MYTRCLLADCSPQKRKPRYYKYLRKICMPTASLSDEREKLMLSDENNKQHIRQAIVAMERNNQSNLEALGKVECPDM